MCQSTEIRLDSPCCPLIAYSERRMYLTTTIASNPKNNAQATVVPSVANSSIFSVTPVGIAAFARYKMLFYLWQQYRAGAVENPPTKESEKCNTSIRLRDD